MSRVLLFIFIFPMLSFANLTKDDLKEIRNIVKEEVELRIDGLEKKMDAKFEAVDRRFEQIDRRFEQIDKRFEDQMSFLYLITSIFTAFTMGVIGFALWDRRTIIDRAKQESLKEIKDELSSNLDRLEKVVQVLHELAKVDDRVANILKKYHLKIV
jgi:phage-related protein